MHALLFFEHVDNCLLYLWKFDISDLSVQLLVVLTDVFNFNKPYKIVLLLKWNYSNVSIEQWRRFLDAMARKKHLQRQIHARFSFHQSKMPELCLYLHPTLAI